MKKVLILVMSSPSIPVFEKLLNSQKETWDSVNVNNVNTIFYYADNSIKETLLNNNNLIIKIEEKEQNNMIKFRMALEYILKSNMEWDYIFRTNSSSYVDKKRLLNKAQTLPNTKCYCGINGGGFASGAGVFFSRDCVEILHSKIDDGYYGTVFEDCASGTILERYYNTPVTVGATRVEYDHNESNFIKNIKFTDVYPYHYRCKSDNSDRSKDTKAFQHIFNYIKSNDL
jgi:hypothetical protein